jgi:hypothetical protein
MLLQHRDPHPPTETFKLEGILFKLWQPPEPHRLESVVVVLRCVPWRVLRDPAIGMERLGGWDGWCDAARFVPERRSIGERREDVSEE